MLKVFLMGVVGHLIMWSSGDFVTLLNNKGQAGTGGEGEGSGEGSGEGEGSSGAKTFTQDQVDSMVGERLARERAKYGNYDELVEFKANAVKSKDAQAQKDLEDRKQYDEVIKGKDTQISTLQQQIADGKSSLDNVKIDNALSMELNAQNAIVADAVQLLKNQAVMTEGGQVMINGTLNGVQTQLALVEGVKQFLGEKPHLVKAGTGGGGTGGGTGSGGGTGGETGGESGNDLGSLMTELQAARNSGDMKRAHELKQKIQAHPKMAGRNSM